MIPVRRTKTQTALFIFGVALILVGILGFIPGFSLPTNHMGMDHGSDNLLLGVFLVGAIHNVVHLITGAIAIYCSRRHFWAVRYFQISAVVYALVAVVGFVSGSFLGLFYVNGADHLLHLGIAAFSAVFGFADRKLTPTK